MKRVLAFSAFIVLLASSALAAPTVFDVPQKSLIQKLPSQLNDSQLSCSYYPHFMVKVVDEGEVGAAQLSILPIAEGGKSPPCQRANLPGERVIDPKDWSGYFKGVRGDYVFFDADDGVNGSLGFAIFSADAKKIFEDSAIGDISAATLSGSVLTLEYERSFAGPCSVQKEGAACWARIAKMTGVSPSAAPDCAPGYASAKAELAKGRCDGDKAADCIPNALKEIDAQHWDDAPSVVEYPVTATITPEKSSVAPQGAAKACHPSD